jgi:hypothetical protein
MMISSLPVHGWRRVVECVGEGWRFLQGSPVLLFPWTNWDFAMHRTKFESNFSPNLVFYVPGHGQISANNGSWLDLHIRLNRQPSKAPSLSFLDYLSFVIAGENYLGHSILWLDSQI